MRMRRYITTSSKQKSFFDNISCEALEGRLLPQQRRSWRRRRRGAAAPQLDHLRPDEAVRHRGPSSAPGKFINICSCEFIYLYHLVVVHWPSGEPGGGLHEHVGHQLLLPILSAFPEPV